MAAGFSQASSFIYMRSNISSVAGHDMIITRASIHFNTNNNNNLAVKYIASNISSRITSKVTAADHEQVIIMEKLYVILEAVTDRIEMHNNIGDQRNNWNTLLLTSINTITLAAATMAAIAAAAAAAAPSLGVLKLSSSFMYLAATGMLIIMNKIQPSQLAEEQRNAARLLKQLEGEIKTKIAIANNPTLNDVNEAIKKVLALDRAYPLPLLGHVMLEKFPAKMEPTVWWPQGQKKTSSQSQNDDDDDDKNGWSLELEKEMREIVRVLEVKDKADYLRLAQKALKLNKVLAIAGPVLTGLGAIGSVFVNSFTWAMVLGVMGGAMATAVNTLQHGGQVGMVLEMYRNNAGFFKMMEESIESKLLDAEDNNGEVFEMKVALQLGRSLSELRDVAASSSSSSSSSTKGNRVEEFGSKLF